MDRVLLTGYPNSCAGRMRTASSCLHVEVLPRRRDNGISVPRAEVPGAVADVHGQAVLRNQAAAPMFRQETQHFFKFRCLLVCIDQP